MKRNSRIDNTHRRTWDKAQYAKKAAEKEEKAKKYEGGESIEAKRRRRWEIDPLHQGLITQRANLKPREHPLDLSSRVGKTQVITVNTPLHQQGAYYCSVCDCTLHDSISYLDHVNGKWHNRALGMSMRVDRSTAEQVRARLEFHKKQKPGTKRKERSEDDEKLQLEYEKCPQNEDEGSDKVTDSCEESTKNPTMEDGLDEEVAALMGFAGFSSSKS